MGFNLKYNIENVGNIDKATITIKPLTIIAGENSSGKTFVTKSLYTILDAIYQKHFFKQLVKHYQSVSGTYKLLTMQLQSTVKIDLDFEKNFEIVNDRFINLLINLSTSTFTEEENLLKINTNFFEEFNEMIRTYLNIRLETNKFKKYSIEIDKILLSLDELMNTINNHTKVITNSISLQLETGMKKNYQITNLQSLINRAQKKDLKLDIETIGEVTVNQKSIMEFDFDINGMEKVQKVQNIVFFDSPVYIKIRKALEKINNGLIDLTDGKYLKGYPKYLDKLYNFIDKEYIDIADFDEISKDIQKIIAGKLDVTKSGDINYIDNNGSTIPLSLTAMGISNIGLIDLLLRNNVINKGSFLIMDEPEVHLHPEWQVALANILYKIAKNGANIIIATHSLDFLKAFEIILKNEEENAEDIIAINKMPYDESFSDLSELEKVGIVLDDLSRPFYNLYMQDI